MSAPLIPSQPLHDANGNAICGCENFKILHRNFRGAFPNMKITIEETVTEADKIAAVCKVTATHEGEGIGVAPTNQPIEFTGLTIVKITLKVLKTNPSRDVPFGAKNAQTPHPCWTFKINLTAEHGSTSMWHFRKAIYLPVIAADSLLL